MSPGPSINLPVSAPVTLEAGLSYLPRWLEPGKMTLPALMTEWLQASSWASARILWPARSTDARSWIFDKMSWHSGMEQSTDTVGAKDNLRLLPEPTPDQQQLILAADPEPVELPMASSDSGTSLACVFRPPGRPRGLLIVHRCDTRDWSRWERDYLRLSARLIERSPALASSIPPETDTEHLRNRLADATILCNRLAHDVDNILTGVIGFADLAMPLLPANSMEADYLHEIRLAAERGQHLSQQLRRLKPTASRIQPTARFAGWFQKLLESAIAGQHERYPIDGNDYRQWPPVQASQESLERLFRELLANAVEAMPDGGRIGLTGEIREIGESCFFLGQPAPGKYLEVCVEDEGIGIKPELQPRLFRELFLTTKLRHRGLGLTVALQVILDCQGGICLEPRPAPQRGTRARVLLPLPPA